MMDIQSLKIFLALCRNLHFGKTSAEFHMSASAMSRTIQRLEGEVGHSLLSRDNRSVRMTQQGEQFRLFALEMVTAWDALQRDMAESSEVLSGSIRLFASVTASQSILPDVLSRFREDYPDIAIQLETGNAIDAIQKLNEGADVVVASLSDKSEPVLIKNVVTSTPIVAVGVPALVELVQDSNDWASAPLVLPGFGQVRDSIDKWLAHQSVKPNVYSEVDGNEAILSLAALGCGIGFVPQLVLDSSPLKKRVEVIQNRTFGEFHVGFCTRSRLLDRSAIIKAFWRSI